MLQYDLYKIGNITYKVNTKTKEVVEFGKEYVVDELNMSSDKIKHSLNVGDAIMEKLSDKLKNIKSISDINFAIEDKKTRHYLQLEKILDNSDFDKSI